MSYAELAAVATFRPLQGIGHFRRLMDRPHSRFDTSWSNTVTLLARELRMMGARRVVLELDMDETDFRIDGLPRANARQRSPGVILSMETPHGPLRYAVDTYADWQENVRAIAKSLEALRAVDRYGVTKRGEQYAGWRALPAGGGSAERGAEIVKREGSVAQALRATHPDTRGDGYTDADFAAVQAYRGEG